MALLAVGNRNKLSRGMLRGQYARKYVMAEIAVNGRQRASNGTVFVA